MTVGPWEVRFLTREMVEANLKAEKTAWKKRAEKMEDRAVELARENEMLREWLDEHGFDVGRILRP